jgi:hypothetical protein
VSVYFDASMVADTAGRARVCRSHRSCGR